MAKVEELTERYVKNSPEDTAKFQAIRHLIDDVERWKAVVIDVDEDGVDFPTVDILLKELRDYTYGGEWK